ncbi:hypothetical protein ABZ312_23665 [Streptomyces sp. NPDC006207]
MAPDAQLWSAFLGFAAPPLIAVVQQPRWSSTAKTLVMLLSSVALGCGSAYFGGQFTAHTVGGNVLIVAIAAGSAYQTVWKPSGVAPRIERATSPRPSRGRHRS